MLGAKYKSLPEVSTLLLLFLVYPVILLTLSVKKTAAQTASANESPAPTVSETTADSSNSSASAGPFVYVGHLTNGTSGAVSVIDTASNMIIATIPVGLNPVGLAVNPAGTRVYVSNYADGTVSVINAISSTVVATIPLGPCPNPSSGIISCAPTGIVVSPDGTRTYVAHLIDSGDPETVFSGAISVIDSLTNTKVATMPIPAFVPGLIALNPQGSRLYIPDGFNSVVVIDPIALQVITTISVGNDPASMAINPAGTKVYVSNRNFAGLPGKDTVSVIESATNQVVSTVLVGSGPEGISVTPNGNRIYVANSTQHAISGTGTVSVIDASTNSVIKTIPVGMEPYGVAVHPDGTRVYVTNVLDSTVSVIDTASNTVIATVPAGGIDPFAIAIGPGNNEEPLTIITSSPLPTGTVNVSYNYGVQATGGKLPYTWTKVSGQLPDGLSISSSGVISGMPTAAAPFFSFQVRVTDADGQFAEKDLSITINFAPTVAVSINDTTVSEGNVGTVAAVFTVTLSAISDQTVTVNYNTANNTATAGSDYVAKSGTLTFNPGETSKTISVPVNGDSIVEANETFFVNLTSATNASIADGQGVGTIIDDDTAPDVRLGNISTRSRVLTGDNVMIGGFIIDGVTPLRVLVRSRGPSMGGAPFFVPGTLANPLLRLFSGQTVIAQNDNWQDGPNCSGVPCEDATQITRTGLDPCQPNPGQPGPPQNCNLESAILVTLPPGAYTAIVTGSDGGTGVGLVEIFEVDDSIGPELSNISTRSFVQSGDNVMIGGMIIEGSAQSTVLIRARGPSMSGAPFFVPGILANPLLQLYSGQTVIAQNNDWQDVPSCTGFTCGGAPQVSATGLDPCQPNPGQSTSPPGCAQESVILITLPPGAYTAIVSGADGGTGVGLVEVFEVN